MEKILLFLGLKVVEISVIVFIPYYVGLSAWVAFGFKASIFQWPMCHYVIGIMFLVVGALLGVFARAVIEGNWRLAGKILKDK